jgi:hypothetical protein
MWRAPMSRRGWLRTVLAAAGVTVASPAPRTLGAPAELKMPDDIPLETFDFESKGIEDGPPTTSSPSTCTSTRIISRTAPPGEVDAFMENIRWDHVSRLHQQYAG